MVTVLNDRIGVLEARAPVTWRAALEKRVCDLEAALGKRIEQLEKAVADLTGSKPTPARSAYDLPPTGGISKRRSKRTAPRR